MWSSWSLTLTKRRCLTRTSFDNDFDGDTTVSYRPTRASLTNRLSLVVFNTLPVTTPINKFVRFIDETLSRDFSFHLSSPRERERERERREEKIRAFSIIDTDNFIHREL